MLPFPPTNAPPGFQYWSDFITRAEEAGLLGELERLPYHEVRMMGVIARRTVMHYGLRYGYESWSLEQAPPLPDFLRDLAARAAIAMEVAPESIAETLVSRYPPGAGIGWHRDAPMFGPSVAGISLLSPATMRFRRSRENGRRTSIPVDLAPRSAYLLGGDARREWQHSIPPVDSLRYSISFRTLAPVAVKARQIVPTSSLEEES